MHKRPLEVLLIEQDEDLAEMIGGFLHEATSVNVTHVQSAREALREELTTRHEVVVLSLDIEDGDPVALLRALRASNRGPVILLADEVSTEQAVEALNLRATALLPKPFDIAELGTLIETWGRRYRQRRHQRQRNRRLRRMTSQIIRDRRELRKKMDLICKDLVYAHKRLTQKVVEHSLIPAKCD